MDATYGPLTEAEEDAQFWARIAEAQKTEEGRARLAEVLAEADRKFGTGGGK